VNKHSIKYRIAIGFALLSLLVVLGAWLMFGQFDEISAIVAAHVRPSSSDALANDIEAARVQTALARQITYAGRLVIAGMAILIILFGLISLLLARSILKPMACLTAALDTIRAGDFSQRLELARRDEFAGLESGFNRMADEFSALVGQAQKTALNVSHAAEQISANTREQQANANETAAATTEIGATSREIVATSRTLARTLEAVSQSAGSTAQIAALGQESLEKMALGMQAVMQAAGTVNTKLNILNEKAGSINMVVTTIARVAGQTNLLSLNAAIEAEKAGEYGRGFSVVAAEIRRLADQSALASADIENIVREIQSSVTSGVMSMDRFSEEVRRAIQDVQDTSTQLSVVTRQVQDLSPQFRAVHEGMQRQAEGAGQISEALVQLSESTRHAVDSLLQSGPAVDDLARIANGLRSGVSRFRVAPSDFDAPAAFAEGDLRATSGLATSRRVN